MDLLDKLTGKSKGVGFEGEEPLPAIESVDQEPEAQPEPQPIPEPRSETPKPAGRKYSVVNKATGYPVATGLSRRKAQQAMAGMVGPGGYKVEPA